MGIQFQIEDAWHFGWLRIRGKEWLEPGTTAAILEWAYETRPGVPILAGAIPEPSALALMLLGGLTVVWRRQSQFR